MNTDEANAILLEVTAAWPSPEFTTEQVVVWRRDLEMIDYEQAMQALGAIRRSSHFRPSLAVFYEAVQDVRRRQQLELSVTKALSEPQMSDEVRDKNMAAMQRLRERLARIPDGHDHKIGRDGCSKCSLHDWEAHHRDCVTGRASCPRCVELAAEALAEFTR